MALLTISHSSQNGRSHRASITAEQYANLRPRYPGTNITGADGPEIRRELLRHGQHSDFRIFCNDQVFHVHRKILAAGSPYFRALVYDGFLESHEAQATIREASPIALAFLLLMLYDGYTKVDTRHFKSFWRRMLTNMAKTDAKGKGKAVADEPAGHGSDMTDLQSIYWKDFQTLLKCYELADRFMLPERGKAAIAKEIQNVFSAALHRDDRGCDQYYLNVSHCADLLEEVCWFCEDTGLDLVEHLVAECFYNWHIVRNGSECSAELLETIQGNDEARCIWSAIGWSMHIRWL